MYNYRATVLRVVDGDTVDLLIDLGFNISIKVRGRLAYVNGRWIVDIEGVNKALAETWPYEN